MPQRQVKVYFDGGCRPNPGRMEAAVILRGETHLFEDMGTGGSFEAEWRALLEALRLVQAQGLDEVLLLGDARAVIGKAQEVLAGGPARDAWGEALCERAEELAARGMRLRLRWIKREQNLAGIALKRRHPR